MGRKTLINPKTLVLSHRSYFIFKKKEKISFLESTVLRENDMIKINVTLILNRISLIVIKVLLKIYLIFYGVVFWDQLARFFFLESVKILVLGHYLAI